MLTRSNTEFRAFLHVSLSAVQFSVLPKASVSAVLSEALLPFHCEAIEIAKNDYRFIPSVYKSMMARLEQGEYIIQNPVFSSLLNIKFPKPIYKQFKQ